MTQSTIHLQGIPYADQYVGVWAMHEPVFAALVEQAKRLDLASHLASDAASELIHQSAIRNSERANDQYRTTVQNGVATIQITGTLMKHASSFGSGTSTVMLRRSMLAAMRDDDVKSILLAIESPGGTSAGTFELAETIAQVRSVKPVIAHIEDLGASAAYWIASQATSISANEPGKIGSIGTYAVINDLSAMAAKEGIKVHVVRAGSEHKGAGVPGTEITASQLAEFQKMVDEVNGFFVRGVAKGRNMQLAHVEALADGRIHIASQAKEHRLIDHVRTFEESLAEATRLASQTATSRGMKMTDQEPETVAVATIKQIKAACPGITSEKLLAFIEDEKSLDQCKDAWMQEMAVELAAKDEALEKANAEAAKSKAAMDNMPGTDGVPETTSASATSDSDYWTAVKAEQSAKGCSRAIAMSAVNRQNPELRKAMLDGSS
jgi:signal peptide peptidase SppA